MSQPAWKIIHSAMAAPAPAPAPARSRTVSLAFGDRRVDLSSSTAPMLLDVAEFLYADFRTEGPAAAEPPVQLRIDRGRRALGGKAERLLLRSAGRPVWRGRGEADAAAALDACIAGHLLPGPLDGIAVLHAACVEVPDRGSVLLCAPSGGGKTTVAAALLAEGCVLAADDLVPVDPTTLLPRGFPRPFALKPGARPPDCALDDWMVLPGEAAPLTFVAPSARLRAGELALPLCAIVFLDHAPRCAEVLLPMAIAHATSLLAPRVAEAPLGDADALAAEIAACTPALLLQYADAAHAAKTLLRAL